MTAESASPWRALFCPASLGVSLKRYLQEQPADTAVLAMSAAVAAQQASLAEALESMLGAAPSDETPPAPPIEWLSDAIIRISQAIAEHSPRASTGLKALSAAVQQFAGARLLAAADGDVEALEELVAAAELPPDAALFVLRQAIQPWMAWSHGARALSLTDLPFPTRRYCPACGGQPLMGKHIEPDGHRYLRCSNCGNEWAFPRIGCPGCGETDAGKFEALFVDGDEGHRIYVCKTCMQYIKISDERLLGGRVHLPLEDIVTLHLDELGVERGYRSVSQGSQPPTVQANDMSH